MTIVTVEDIDITQVEVDALIMGANTLGYYDGAIDRAVERVSGRMFFDQIDWRTDLSDGQVVFAPATHEHDGSV